MREDSDQEHSFAAVIGVDEKLKRNEGEAFGAYHSYGEEKVVAFTEYINYALKDDAHLAAVLPMKSEDLFTGLYTHTHTHTYTQYMNMVLFTEVSDGLVLHTHK